MLETSLKTWQSEVGRYFEEYLADSEATFKALAACKEPMDVLTVEPQWLKRRAQAYLDSGLRFAQAFADVAKTRIVPPTKTEGAPPPAFKDLHQVWPPTGGHTLIALNPSGFVS